MSKPEIRGALIKCKGCEAFGDRGGVLQHLNSFSVGEARPPPILGSMVRRQGAGVRLLLIVVVIGSGAGNMTINLPGSVLFGKRAHGAAPG